MQRLQLKFAFAGIDLELRHPVRAERPETLLKPETPPAKLDGLILHGDAFDLFEQLPAASVDLLVTSPPYWGHRTYNLDHNWALFNDIQSVRKLPKNTEGYEWYRSQGGVLGLEPYPDWYVKHLAEILTRSRRVLKATGSIWLNIGDTYFARWSSIRESGRQGLADGERIRRRTPMGGYRQEKQLLLVPARVAIEMQEFGWILRNDLIWYKPNATPRPEDDRLKLSHEHLFHFVLKPTSGRASYFYDISAVEPRKSDVVTVNVEPGEDAHTATFPEELIVPRVASTSPLGGVVLDPFCGTGRSLVVAKRLGRRVVGFDAQAKYCELTRRKLSANGKGKKNN